MEYLVKSHAFLKTILHALEGDKLFATLDHLSFQLLMVLMIFQRITG